MTHPAQDALAALDKIAIFARTGCQMCPNALNSLVDTVKAGIQSASREWMDIIDMPPDEVCLVSGHSEGNPKRERWYVTGIKVCGSIVSEDGRDGLSYADKFQFIDKIPTQAGE